MTTLSRVARGAFAALGFGLLVLAIPYAMLTEARVPVPAVMGMGVAALGISYAMSRQAR